MRPAPVEYVSHCGPRAPESNVSANDPPALAAAVPKIALYASIRPQPVYLSYPGPSVFESAESTSFWYTWNGFRLGNAWRTRAATAAACGAAADVPWKFGNPSRSGSSPGMKKLVLAPSGAAMSGPPISGPPAIRLPALSKITVIGPLDVKPSRTRWFWYGT